MDQDYDKVRRLTAEAISSAKSAEENGQPAEASHHWKIAAQGFHALAKIEPRVIDQTRLKQKALQAEQRARQPETVAPVKIGANSGLKSEYAGFGDEFIARSTVTWDEIGGMAEAKESLIYAMGLQLARKPEHVVLEIPSRILLYGPPGTGKTLLASACASTIDATFFNVKVSALLSKYVGESANLISALYQRAREAADAGLAVVFIDEYDSLARSRDKSDSSANSQVIATLLTELDGLGEKRTNSSVITIVATNRPWDLDEAILSRMDLRILVDLPDEAARAEIFRVLLQGRGVTLASDVTPEKLAEATEHFSGRDIQRLCKKLFLSVLAEQNEALAARVRMNQAREYTLRFRALTWSDVTRAKQSVKVAPPTESEMQRYRQW